MSWSAIAGAQTCRDGDRELIMEVGTNANAYSNSSMTGTAMGTAIQARGLQ
jgi:hypothetical protein